MNARTPPSPEGLRRAKVAWEQSAADLRDAQARLRDGAGLESSFFSLQAALNALAAVSRLYGHVQLPNHSPAQMLALCREADARFASLGDAVAALETVQEQDPFRGPHAPGGMESGRKALADATAVHKTVRAFLKEHRKTYFSP
ncbi:MAG: hypothetical protein HY342_06930 [Candidatus Lambdaproteobacteria bacterium]|nr:hypothetical protein [Candidatus Lambdaproteobacteria bacterium]